MKKLTKQGIPLLTRNIRTVVSSAFVLPPITMLVENSPHSSLTFLHAMWTQAGVASAQDYFSRMFVKQTALKGTEGILAERKTGLFVAQENKNIPVGQKLGRFVGRLPLKDWDFQAQRSSAATQTHGRLTVHLGYPAWASLELRTGVTHANKKPMPPAVSGVKATMPDSGQSSESLKLWSANLLACKKGKISDL